MDDKQRLQLHISVRNLVEFLLRTGDIDEGSGSGNALEVMQAGSRIHRKIQKRMGAEYHAEVPLSYEVVYEDYDLAITGRADGIIMDEDANSATIDEIKGVYTDLDSMKEGLELHYAQAQCYAYFLACENHYDNMDISLTYCNLDTEEIKRFYRHYTYQELADWFEELLQQYKKWADFSYDWMVTRKASIQQLTFPFPYRPHQKELIAKIYYTITNHQILFLQAPTGVGKTIATIYPSIMALGTGEADKIFYLTGKTVTRVVARDTFHLLKQCGYRGKTVEITAKDKICPLKERACNPKDCPYALGHFDRINDAVYDLLMQEDMLSREVIYDWSQKRNVCPFELSLDLASWCDHIICDYNYVFHPNVYLKRFFAEGNAGNYIFLMDEAHNLIDRGRDMYSQNLKKEDFLHIKKYFKTYHGEILKALDACNKIMLEWKKNCEGKLILTEMDSFLFALLRLANLFEKFFETRVEIEGMDEIRDFYFNIRNFIRLSEGLDEHYVLYCDFNASGEFILHMFCVDPSVLLQQRLDRAIAAVFFSATLLPMGYYKSLLCTTKKPYALYADSPFDSRKRKILIGKDVTSLYTQRSFTMYLRYAQYIHEITSVKKGNYMIFFPSYEFMKEVYAQCMLFPTKDTEYLLQMSQMTEDERKNFLQAFEKKRKKSLLAFCVMGGIFSEGIDLTNEKLIGAIIAGVGLPKADQEQQMIQDYFDKKHKDGFSYAYLFPGMNKVLQSAGRVIRTVEDKGVIILLDERFMQMKYRSIFPREWSDAGYGSKEEVIDEISHFWDGISDSKKV